MEIIAGVIIFLFGLIIGSFLNVCILRLPEGKPISRGRSACPGCGATLSPPDLVPLFSYLILRGKCRHCGMKISPLYPAVESLTGVLFVLLFIAAGLSWQLLVYMALTAILVAAAFTDWRTMTIPDGLIIALLIVGAVQLAATILTGVFGNWLDYVIGFFAGGVPLLLLALLFTYVFKKEAFGGGDIKLMAAAGLITGWELVVTSYIIGIILGGIAGVVLLASGKKKRGDEMPFGPYLAIGILASVFFGNALINWYLGMF